MKRKLIARNKLKLGLYFRQIVYDDKKRDSKQDLSYSDIVVAKEKGQKAFEQRLQSFENMNPRQKKKRQRRLLNIGYDESRFKGMAKVRLAPAIAKWRREEIT